MLKTKDDNLSIGILLCNEKNKVKAEYALKDINKPIGISEYELIKAIPEDLKSNLPTVEEIEQEISEKIKNDDNNQLNWATAVAQFNVIKNIIRKHKHNLSKGKTIRYGANEYKKVTGFVIAQNNKLVIPNKIKSKIKAQTKFIRKKDLDI